MINRLIPVFLLVLCSINTSNADIQRGVTGVAPEPQIGPVILSPATTGVPAPVSGSNEAEYISPWLSGLDDWVPVASDSFSIFVPDCTHFAVAFNPGSEELFYVDPNVELSDIQQQAIARAPAWLRADLYDNFRRFLYSFVADFPAQEILNAPDPYVDEVAFECAHIAPGVLGSMYYQLLLENVEEVYAVDSTLGFVDIVDYGDSNDDDYWSTVVYRMIEENGDTVEVEMDREYYYWYIVHPKISDEDPTYIVPETGQQGPPPYGVFWRDYLWNYADPGYPLLSEQWSDCEFLWDRTGNSTDAIDVLNTWINDVMSFGAGSERPIQPVRIYVLHCGNCGEFSDITAAAARTCLVPTVGTMNICEDHTWNEFWVGDEWIHWEPVNYYVNNPLVYENGWGKTLSAVYNYRGDGYVWDVTERYSEGICTLNVTVYDSLGRPADGQKITVESEALWGGTYAAIWGVTNSLGQVSFVLGDDQNFYLRIDGPLGSYPAFGTVSVINGSVAGESYSWEHTMEAHQPEHQLSQAPDPPNPLDDYRLDINYRVEYETAYATFLNNNEFSLKLDTGVTDVFIADEGNYQSYAAFQPAEGYGFEDNVSEGAISFVLPTDDPYYAVFSSRELCKNSVRLNLVVDVYRNGAPGVSPESGADLPLTFALEAPHPNPFNDETVVRFDIAEAGEAKVAVYDVSGRVIAVLSDGYLPQGRYETVWAASGSASGVYIVSLDAGGKRFARKICHLR
jgi:hypothetical protein